MTPTEEQKKVEFEELLEEAYQRNQRPGAYNPTKQKEPCLHANEGRLCPYCKQEYALLRRAYDLGASREQQVAENAVRVIEGIPKTFLDHKEDGRREYNLDEQRAYNRAVFDISKAIHSASSPFLNRKGK